MVVAFCFLGGMLAGFEFWFWVWMDSCYFGGFRFDDLLAVVVLGGFGWGTGTLVGFIVVCWVLAIIGCRNIAFWVSGLCFSVVCACGYLFSGFSGFSVGGFRLRGGCYWVDVACFLGAMLTLVCCGIASWLLAWV